MQFNPKTATEIQQERSERMKLLPIGIYDFTVSKCEERISKKGNPMFVAVLKVYSDGAEKLITDYILSNDQEKLYGFAMSTGLDDQYRGGGLESDDCEGRDGRLKLGIERGQDDGNGGTYPEKNRVMYYVWPEAKKKQSDGHSVNEVKRATKVAPAKPADDDDGDDIPF